MKKAFIQIIGLLALATITVFSINAQTPKTFRANISFDFNVGGKTFEAGEYIIEQTNPSVSNGALIIRNAEKNEAKIFMVIKLSNDELSHNSNLLFNRYENQYFLTEMVTPMLCAKFY